MGFLPTISFPSVPSPRDTLLILGNTMGVLAVTASSSNYDTHSKGTHLLGVGVDIFANSLANCTHLKGTRCMEIQWIVLAINPFELHPLEGDTLRIRVDTIFNKSFRTAPTSSGAVGVNLLSAYSCNQLAPIRRESAREERPELLSR